MILITVRVGIYLTCGSHRMTESFHKEDFFLREGLKLVKPRHFLLEFLYQAKKVIGHVFVC